MRVRLTLGLLLVAVYGVLPAWPQAPAGSQLLVLTNANVIDGVSEKPIRGATVIVRDGKIVSVATTSPKIPHGATVLDLKGRWLLPGLIDAHVHVNEAQARVALESGVTTVRTGNGGLSVRVQHRAGVATLPDVVASGFQVVKQPGERFFQEFPQLADMKDGVRGPDHMRRIVRALIDRGVDVIKILATERAGLQDADPRRRTFTDEELVAATEAATLGKRAVMAHAHGDEGASAAVRAGVRSIEHGTYLSDATLSLMKARGTFFVPTISVLERYAPNYFRRWIAVDCPNTRFKHQRRARAIDDNGRRVLRFRGMPLLGAVLWQARQRLAGSIPFALMMARASGV